MSTALVVGGGVAGPVAAMALREAGVEVTLVEGRDRPADDTGLFFTLQANGLDALRAIGAAHLAEGLGFATDAMRFRSGTGKVLGEQGTGPVLPDGTRAVTLRRADLYTALCAEAQRRGIPVEFGRRLVAATGGAAVRAEFADGAPIEADLLVGADGVHSRVRTLIDPDAARPRYVPLLNVGGYAPPQLTPARPGQYEMIFGRKAFFLYAVAPDGAIWWAANPPRATEPARGELAAVDDAAWRARLLELFADDDSPACAIIRSAPGPLAGWTTHDLPRVRRWHRDGMVIVGDAAHATSPSSGQGASMAIEDGVELGRCVRDLGATGAALDAFVALRRDRVERVVRLGEQSGSQKVPGRFGRVARDLTLPLVLRLVGRMNTDWLHRHHIDWDAPVAATHPAPA